MQKFAAGKVSWRLPNVAFQAQIISELQTVRELLPTPMSSTPLCSTKSPVALAKDNPGRYSFASGGVGSPGHLVGAQLRVSYGVDLVHVPFGSAGLAIGSTIGGHTPISIVAPVATVPQVQEGKDACLCLDVPLTDGIILHEQIAPLPERRPVDLTETFGQ
jgi:tripartite-type tricarboxylate transporter receptor subunit TctC